MRIRARERVPKTEANPIVARSDALLDDLAFLGEPANLAFVLVHVDANMLHG